MALLSTIEVTVDYLYDGEVVYVSDGDTLDADLSRAIRIDWGFHNVQTIVSTFRWRLRILGLNAPEVHGASKTEGLVAKQYTIDHLMGRPIVVRSAKTDDFGRWLAAIKVDEQDYTAEMIADGMAVPFMVGK